MQAQEFYVSFALSLSLDARIFPMMFESLVLPLAAWFVLLGPLIIRLMSHGRSWGSPPLACLSSKVSRFYGKRLQSLR